MLRSALASIAFALCLPVLAEELRVPLPGRDDLVINLPVQWRAQIRRPHGELPPSVAISGPDAKALQMFITPIWPVGSAPSPTADELRGLVQAGATRVQPKAVESELPLKNLGAPGKTGYYFSATDRAPEPDGYQHLTQGVLGMNELRVTFTVLVNGAPQEPTAQALELLRSLRRAPASKAP
ncbi:hypothetical protein [Acidovorax sp.]|uniref:hypothetical protein n=1 Tax=Acidovorax sp. TaxID=1872122 RepID=UPI002611B367|nr:hypothetical protein [Acidovorax sp.]